METLEKKFAELLNWERRKRHEQVLALAVCMALAAAIVFLPLNAYLPRVWLRWLVPAILALALAPLFFCRARWRRRDSARALVELDKLLRLDERAVTAWELSAAAASSGAALLVLHQAEEKLRTIEPRALLPRRWTWPAYAAAPMLGLWLALLALDFDRAGFDQGRALQPPTLAQKLREFSRELQDKARNEGLRETLKMGQELEKTAQKNIEAKTADEQVKKEIAGVAQTFASAAKSARDKDVSSTLQSEQSLKDLKAELEAMRDLMMSSAQGKGAQELGPGWMERLGDMPQLKRQLAQGERGGQSLSQNELQSFLEKLEQQVGGELDRRAVIDAQKYLEQMIKQGRSEKGENYACLRSHRGLR